MSRNGGATRMPGLRHSADGIAALPHDDWPHLYAWRVDGRQRGACGVTDRFGQAARRFLAALHAIPEGSGNIQAVWLDAFTDPPGYAYGRVLTRGRRDKRTGGIVMDDDDGT